MHNLAMVIFLLFAFASLGCIYPDQDGGQDNHTNYSQQNLTGGIYGVITDQDGIPLENVSIHLIGRSFNYTKITDARGNYNLSQIVPGAYAIFIYKKDYKNITANLTIPAAFNRPWSIVLFSSTCSLYGTINSPNGTSIQNATIILAGETNYTNTTGEDGNYSINGIQPGIYSILVEKPLHKNISLANFTVLEGQSYHWDATMYRDCIYYDVNSSSGYSLLYGFTGTLYKGEMEFAVSYPGGATYEIHPAADNQLSRISTSYKAGNRMLDWTLDNLEGDYSYVQGHIYVRLNGTQAMHIFQPREMNISDASSGQPRYLGAETTSDGIRLIDPSNSEIKEIAQQVKSESGSNDSWNVARAMFIWLKNNTQYYISGEGAYTHTPLETLRSRKGKCDELAHLYVSMLRSVGIPARFVKGYLIEHNPDLYIGHRWVEFYDGEWVTVEVAGNSGNASYEADRNFGIRLPAHVPVFTDDGTSQSIEGVDANEGTYYDKPPEFVFEVNYNALGFDPKYLAVCSDGTRSLKENME